MRAPPQQPGTQPTRPFPDPGPDTDPSDRPARDAITEKDPHRQSSRRKGPGADRTYSQQDLRRKGPGAEKAPADKTIAEKAPADKTIAEKGLANGPLSVPPPEKKVFNSGVDKKSFQPWSVDKKPVGTLRSFSAGGACRQVRGL